MKFLKAFCWCMLALPFIPVPVLGEPLITNWKIYENLNLGFKIQYVGEVVQCPWALTCFRLPIEGAWVSVTIETRPAVLLPGTYGGWYYFDENLNFQDTRDQRKHLAPLMRKQLVFEQITFMQDFWVLYGGSGSWDTVINCFTLHNGLYYIISLHYPFLKGIPLSAAELERMAMDGITRMSNIHDPLVIIFEQMLKSFSFVR